MSSGIPETKFDAEIYSSLVGEFESAIRKAPLMTIGEADSAKALLGSNVDIFRLSVGLPIFTQTLSLGERLFQLKRTNSNRDFVDAVPGFLTEALADLPGYVAENPGVYLGPVYEATRVLSGSINPGLQRLVTDIYSRNLNNLIGMDSLTRQELDGIVGQIVKQGDVEQVRMLAREAVTPDSLVTQKFSGPMNSVLNLGILGLNIYERPDRMLVVLDEITGGQGANLIGAWNESEGRGKDEKGSESVHLENFGIVCQLENTRLGLTRNLINQYGVMALARYPLSLLLEQASDHLEGNSPYGALMAARFDKNGLFNRIKNETENAYEQLKDLGYDLMVAEAGDLDEMFKTITRFRDTRGQMAFMIIMAHGDPGFISFGSSKVEAVSDLVAEPRFTDAFMPSAPIGLVTCSGGSREGIGQALSNLFPGTEIHSPDHIVYMKENGIKFGMKDGKLDLKILFWWDDGNYWTNEDELYASTDIVGGLFNIRTRVPYSFDVPTRVYREGQLVRDYTS